MLTVDYQRLGLQPGHVVLDMGCGAGRHAFESLRRGARVVAFDRSFEDLVEVDKMCRAMSAEGQIASPGAAVALQGDALRLPFRDATFDRIVASEVLEHIGDDRGALAELARVLKPGGLLAATVPAWLAEKVCWALSAEYHAPLAQGGHVRIYTEAQLRARLARSGLEPCGSHHAHALHSPYWWLRCAVGPTNDEHPLVRAYHRMLVWDIARAPFVMRFAERVLNPVIGKSVVVYAAKPVSAPSTPTEEVDRVAA